MIAAIRRLDPTLPLPSYQTTGAVAFDFTARLTTVVEPGAIALIPGNVVVKVPDGYALLVVPRSSMPRKKGLSMPHSMGVIDGDFHGPDDEILIQVRNDTAQSVTVERGERIAQGLFVRIDRAEWQEVDDHGAPTRGGFGTTGSH
jgi:dUTP pyrophosphatase